MTFSTLAILIVRSKLQESCHGLILNSNLGDDDDSLVVVGIDSSMTYVNLGPGADKAAFTLCNFVTLMVDREPTSSRSLPVRSELFIN